MATPEAIPVAPHTVPAHFRPNLSSAQNTVSFPTYNRSDVGQSWVHIGLGNFHRAHQAVYADDLLQKFGASEWGICGIGLLPSDALVDKILRS